MGYVYGLLPDRDVRIVARCPVLPFLGVVADGGTDIDQVSVESRPDAKRDCRSRLHDFKILLLQSYRRDRGAWYVSCSVVPIGATVTATTTHLHRGKDD